MSRAFYDRTQNADDMQMQVYGLLAAYIDEANVCIIDKNPVGVHNMLMIIYPCIHTRIKHEERGVIKEKMFELRDALADQETLNDPIALTIIMDELYDLYLRLQEVLQGEGITLKLRADPGSIVARNTG